MDRHIESPVMKGALPFHDLHSSVLAIHCSDSRYQDTSDELIKTHLHHGSFYRIAVPGGAQFLSVYGFYPKLEWSGKHMTKFLIDRAGVKEIILISHADCAWYKWLKEINRREKDTPLKKYITGDTTKQKQILQKMFPHVAVRAFYMEPNEGNVDFIRI